MCKHVPVKPCQTLMGVCVAEEEVLEPPAKCLKGKHAFVLPKEIFDGFVLARYLAAKMAELLPFGKVADFLRELLPLSSKATDGTFPTFVVRLRR